ncbi:MAG: hypothetical protein AAGD92_17005, partial [Pseudomonadota bacterium]
MHIHPDIAALRGGSPAQRRPAEQMREALNAWQDGDGGQRILRDLEAYGAGEPLADCCQLHALVNDHQQALGFADEWCGALLATVRNAPLAEMPLRYTYSQGLSTVQVCESGGATLSLVAYERQSEGSGNSPMSAVFADRESR